MDRLIYLDPTPMAVAAGGQATVTVRLFNPGAVVDTLRLSVVGEPAAWSFVDQPAVGLFPGAEGQATVHFRPPRRPDVPAGPWHYGVKATSTQDPRRSQVEEGAITVAPYVEVAARLVPRQTKGSRGARHRVVVESRGNAPVHVTLQPTDPDELLHLRVRPAQAVIPPGGALRGELRLRPADRFLTGGLELRGFSVVVSPDGAPAVTAEGQFRQKGTLGSWIARLFALAVVGGGIAAVVYFSTAS